MGERFAVRCSPNPSGLCMCDCGRRTVIARQNHRRTGMVKGEPVRFARGHNGAVPAPTPRPGEGYIDSCGYVALYRPNHPAARAKGKIREHVLIACRVLGRPLRGTENVHHVNRGRADNRHQNLVICPDHGYHTLIEARGRAFEACGHADWVKCRYCGEWMPRDTERIWVRSFSRIEAYHLDCHAAAERERQHAA